MVRRPNTTAAWILTLFVATHWAAFGAETRDPSLEQSGIEPRIERAADTHPGNIPRAVRVIAQSEWKLSSREPQKELPDAAWRGALPSRDGALLAQPVFHGGQPLTGDPRRYDPRAPPA